MRRLPWSLLLLDGALPERGSWQRFMLALQNGRVPCDLRTRWHAACLPIDHDWPAAVAQLSRKHRQRMTSARRKLDDLGGMSFQRFALSDDEGLEPQLLEAFSIEDHGWKGAAGTAVLRVPGIFAYLVQACRILAKWGNVHLALLRAGETPIAFCLGIVSKGVWHSCKIGYDAAFAEVLPGHLLHYCLQEESHGDASCQAIDYMGPATEYHRHWRPGAYPVARLAVAPRGMLGKLALWSYGRFKGESLDGSTTMPDFALPTFEPIPIGSNFVGLR
jgi:CelD/BcsL family acetyltransferase involved in cellulose biosynthesis